MFLAWRVADPEGRTYDMLFIGFPWVLALITLRDHIAGDSLFRYFVALILNVATVYVLTLAVVRISTDDSK